MSPPERPWDDPMGDFREESEEAPRRGEVWWASMREPVGSEPGSRRPVVVVSSDEFNRSRIHTVLVAAVTSNIDLAHAPGNVLVASVETGLPRESVVNVSQLATLDKSYCSDRVGSLGTRTMVALDNGLRTALQV